MVSYLTADALRFGAKGVVGGACAYIQTAADKFGAGSTVSFTRASLVCVSHPHQPHRVAFQTNNASLERRPTLTGSANDP